MNKVTPNPHHSQRGQSLVEILIATAVVAMVLTGVAAGIVFSVRNTAEARYRAVAGTLAQESIEVFRRERDRHGWRYFQSQLASPEYCFNTLPADISGFAALAGSCQSSFTPAGSGTLYRRDVRLQVAAESVLIEVTMSWQSGAEWEEATISQELRNF